MKKAKNKLFVLLMIIFIRSCVNEVPLIYTSFVNLLNVCFQQPPKLIVITKNTSEVMNLILKKNVTQMSIILIDNLLNTRKKHSNCNFKPEVYILSSEKSFEIFGITMMTLKSNSLLWNEKAFFFIIESMNNMCNKSAQVLEVAWKFKLLSVLYLCQMSGKLKLYTYNPFANYAPYPWKKVLNNPSSQWNLFYRDNLFEGVDVCENLNFDKTIFINGYKVNAIAHTRHGKQWKHKKDYNLQSLREFIPHRNAIFFINVFTKLNVTAVIHYDKPGIEIDIEAKGILKHLRDGDYDIGLNYQPLRAKADLGYTYPFHQMGFAILTHHRDFRSPEEKILSFFGIDIIILSLVSFVVTVVVLIFFRKQEFSLAVFEVLRIVLYVGMLKPLHPASIRIFFFGIYLLIIILNGSFQGQLSAFLTTPDRKDVETLKHLDDWGYQTYTNKLFKQYIDNWPTQSYVQNNLHEIKEIDCYDYVLSSSKAACIAPVNRLLEPAIDHNLHISESVARVLTHYWIRKDLPIAQKIDTYSWWLMETGLLRYWHKKYVIIPLEKLRFREVQQIEHRTRPIHLADLKFAFEFLIFCLAVSVIAFVCEILAQKYFRNFYKKDDFQLKVFHYRTSASKA